MKKAPTIDTHLSPCEVSVVTTHHSRAVLTIGSARLIMILTTIGTEAGFKWKGCETLVIIPNGLHFSYDCRSGSLRDSRGKFFTGSGSSDNITGLLVC